MKLTQKDKLFLESLKQFMDSHDLTVELRPGEPSYMVLRGTYGEKVHQAFRMSRQGVRWRFQRLADVYISAFESILFFERILGPQLREYAIRISKERHELRQRALENGFQSADSLIHRRQPPENGPDSATCQLTRDSPSQSLSSKPLENTPQPGSSRVE